ncbi:MAG: hypothetical protein ABI442_07920 [Gemmatimonadaceae bacterium]
MSISSLTHGLSAASALLFAIAGFRWEHLTVASAPAGIATSMFRTTAAPPDVQDDALSDAETLTVENDPFRLSRMPSTTRFDAPAASPMRTPAGLPHPTLVLKAIVGGPPWQAVIDGLPGQTGSAVAQPGAHFEGLVVRVVSRDSVVVQGADTTWVLSFRVRS